MSESGRPRLLDDPRVQELLALRRRRYLTLSVIVSAIYTIVALACAFAPERLRQDFAGTGVSLGITSMILIIVVAIVSAGYYTWWSNTVRDPLTARILKTLADKRA